MKDSKQQELQFAKNKNGHNVFTIVGDGLTDEQMVERFCNIEPFAKQVLLSSSDDSCDKKHRLVEGERYNIVLIRDCEMAVDFTAADVKEYAQSFGYEALPLGSVPHIANLVSEQLLQNLDIWYIAVLHVPFAYSEGSIEVGYVSTESYFDAYKFKMYWMKHERLWWPGGAFAFLDSAS